MNKECKKIRKKIIEISALGHDGNLQSCFSSIEIIWSLFDGILKYDKNFYFDKHDRFVLSKGQSNLALLTIMAFKGLIEMEELQTFCKFNSRISMQGDRTKFNGILENSAGSLGHGLPLAVGMAWASKIIGDKERIFVLAGDGEMNEGTMWESILFASSERLNNLTLIIDDNDSIGKMIDFGNLKLKLESFGLDVVCVDGHSIKELKKAYNRKSDKPMAIIAKTIRGYGSPTLMRDRSWFHRFPKDDEIECLRKEIDCFEKDNATLR